MRTLWSLGTQSMVHMTADRIGITALSVIRARRNIVDALISVIPRVIKWLNRSEVQTIILYFQITRGFPNVIWGSRRYSYEIYTSPKQSRAIYYPKEIPFFVLANLLFIHAYVGGPESIHDARVPIKSDVWDYGK